MRNSVFTFFIVVFVLFSFAPSLYELSRSGDVPESRQFELTHNDPAEYHGYLARIRKGIEGARSPDLYELLGRAGRWNRVPAGRAGDVYHMARLVLVFTLLTSVATLCRKLFLPPWEVLTFLLMIILSFAVLIKSPPHVLLYEVCIVFLLIALARNLKGWQVSNRLRPFVALVVIAMGFANMLSFLARQRDDIDLKNSSGGYPLKDVIFAIKVLEDRLPRDAIVLSDADAGSYIPVYSGNSVYTGPQTTSFFSGEMSTSAAQAFIQDKAIAAVFFMSQERLPYPFLQEMYKNDSVTIYKP